MFYLGLACLASKTAQPRQKLYHNKFQLEPELDYVAGVSQWPAERV